METAPTFREKKAEIMLRLLKYYTQETVPDKPIHKEEPKTILQRILEELQDVPANSPEWQPQRFDAFIKDIEELRQKKYQECEAPREKLKLALAELVKEEKALSFFDYFSGVSSWTAEMCSLSEVEGLTEKVQNLHRLVAEYQEVLVNRPTPTSYAEGKTQSAEMEEKVRKIADIYDHLNKLFATPQKEPLVIKPEPEEDGSRKLGDMSESTSSPSSENGTEEIHTGSSEPEAEKEAPKEEMSIESLSESESNKNSLLANDSNDNKFVPVKQTQKFTKLYFGNYAQQRARNQMALCRYSAYYNESNGDRKSSRGCTD